MPGSRSERTSNTRVTTLDRTPRRASIPETQRRRADYLSMGTTNPAPAFGLPGREIEIGRAADFILIDSRRPELSPSHSLTSDLVYRASGDIVVCDGRVIMRDREIACEEKILADARQAARALFARL
jgi:5-methylthioadenosine/S-adenosylhomocysteine deaminase